MSAFLEDARRFVLANRYIGELAPLQLYSSAIVFAPQTSVVRQVCGQIPVWVTECPITPATWSLELQKLEGHTDSVTAVAFPPDGSLLASASEDQTVRLWNARTGQAVQTLKGHTDYVKAVAFSPDGSLLASASYDKTVRLWNPVTGEQLQRLDGDPLINDISFTMDNKTLLTNRGPICIGIDPASVKTLNADGDNTLILNHDWLEHGGHRILWLPQEYRSDVSAFYGSRLAIGQKSGRVSFLSIEYA